MEWVIYADKPSFGSKKLVAVWKLADSILVYSMPAMPIYTAYLSIYRHLLYMHAWLAAQKNRMFKVFLRPQFQGSELRDRRRKLEQSRRGQNVSARDYARTRNRASRRIASHPVLLNHARDMHATAISWGGAARRAGSQAYISSFRFILLSFSHFFPKTTAVKRIFIFAYIDIESARLHIRPYVAASQKTSSPRCL